MTEILSSSSAVQAIGYALVAFLWQGAAIGVVAVLVAALSRWASPDTRYALGCVALVALVLAPAITASRHLQDRPLPIARDRAVSDSAVLSTTTSTGEPPRAIAKDVTTPGGEPLSTVVLVWGAGVCLFGVHLLRGGRQVARLRRSASPLVAADRLETLRRLSARLGLTSPVQLFESRAIDVPAAIGWLRPAIVVPVSALAGLSPSHFEAILAHELAHVRRHDYLVNVVQRLVETLLFYHPAVWWVSGWIRREREHCCDELAASVCGDRVGYARALRALEELRADTPALAMGASGGDLLVRIRRLVDRTPVPAPGWPGGVAMFVPLVAFLAVGSVIGGQASSVLSVPAVQVRPIETIGPVGTGASPSPQVLPATPVVSSLAVPRRVRRAIAAPQVGEVSGTVTDPSGGVIPGATVFLKSQTASEGKTAVTNATGTFAFNDVATGDYNLDVTIPGFRRNSRTIQVAAGQRLTARIQLQLGMVAEELTVTGQAGAPVVPAGQLPANLESAADYRAAALYYYTREAFADADAMTTRAIDLIRASQPQVLWPPDRPGVVRVGGSIREPRKTVDVRPIYPSAALASGSAGVVRMDAIIARDGTVSEVTITSAPSVFDSAAIGAVRQWTFRPTELNGVPVEVMMTVTVNFTIR
ncbi:MAG TPA: M56 family metallopeptidase [Vicinamibacterales bacterium]|nr:M56 family metallopeptidase [Vicinamibacterales bacterium]